MKIFWSMIFFISAAHAGLGMREPGWRPGQTINVRVFDADETDMLCVRSVMKEIQTFANIHLVAYDKVDAALRGRRTQVDLYVVRPGAHDADGGHSDMGNSLFVRESVTVRLNKDTSQSQRKECTWANLSTVRHEFGHLLGLEHEHQHPDVPFMISQAVIKTHTKMDRDFLEPKHGLGMWSLMTTKYDINSVMHYSFTITGEEVQMLLLDGMEPRSMRDFLDRDTGYKKITIEKRGGESRLIACPYMRSDDECWDKWSFALDETRACLSRPELAKQEWSPQVHEYSEGDKAILGMMYPAL